MQSPQPGIRVNLHEFKKKLLSVLGHVKENEYWRLLAAFLSFKLTKRELDTLVPATIGKENLWLHNQFVGAIYSNAHSGSPPFPPPALRDVSRHHGEGVRKAGSIGAHSDIVNDAGGLDEDQGVKRYLENGDTDYVNGGRPLEEGTLPPLPKRARYALTEDGTPGLRVPFRTARRVADSPSHPSAEVNGSREPKSSDRSRGDKEDKKEEEEVLEDEVREESATWQQSAVYPPLGVPFCTASLGSSTQPCHPKPLPLPLTHSLLGQHLEADCDPGELPDNRAVQVRMQRLARHEHDLQGLGAGCVELMQAAIEVRLKSIMGACIKLIQARGCSDNKWRDGQKGGSCRDRPADAWSTLDCQNVPLVNGVSHLSAKQQGDLAPGLPSSNSDDSQGRNPDVSAQDLLVAVEQNPQLLGEDQPYFLERILQLV